MKRLLILVLAGVFVFHLTGCVGTQTFSNSARPGDTIVVALKIVDGNQFLAPADFTAEIEDQYGGFHSVNVVRVVRAYADPLSEAALKENVFATYGPKYDGQWMAIVELFDRGPLSVPPIPAGPATLHLTHPSVALHDPALEILDGIGTPHPLESTTGFGNVSPHLDAAPHVGVNITGTPSATVAGATLVIQYDSTKFPVNTRPVRAVKFSQDPNIQLLSTTRDIGGGMKELEIILLNPNGFDAASVADFTELGKSGFKDLSFVLTWAMAATAGSYSPVIPTDMTLVSSEFIDVNGDPVSGVVADLADGYGYTRL